MKMKKISKSISKSRLNCDIRQGQSALIDIALRELRQEDLQFEASLGHIVFQGNLDYKTKHCLKINRHECRVDSGSEDAL